MSNKPTKLPHLPKLKVLRPTIVREKNPCLVTMSLLMSCWASSGEGAQACLKLEQDLKICMDKQGKVQPTGKASTNYHLKRLKNKVNPKPYD